MAKVADKKVRPGLALPIRVHDLFLGLAGRVDDDAITEARELLATAEVDRALELITGCLVAGRIAVTTVERDELEAVLLAANSDAALISRIRVAELEPTRHQFGAGEVAGRRAEEGVAAATRRMLDLLPDIRAMWCVWRLTPAGAVSGPVPRRLVLVDLGPDLGQRHASAAARSELRSRDGRAE